MKYKVSNGFYLLKNEIFESSTVKVSAGTKEVESFYEQENERLNMSSDSVIECVHWLGILAGGRFY